MYVFTIQGLRENSDFRHMGSTDVKCLKTVPLKQLTTPNRGRASSQKRPTYTRIHWLAEASCLHKETKAVGYL